MMEEILEDLLSEDKEKVILDTSLTLKKDETNQSVEGLTGKLVGSPEEEAKGIIGVATPTKTPTSKPWSANDNPWSPDIFKVPIMPGWRLRFVSPSKVDLRKSQGWLLVEQNELTGLVSSHSIDTTYRARRMLLMKITEELAKKREKFFSDLTNQRSKTAETGEVEKEVGKIEKDMGEDQSFRMSIKRRSKRGYL